MTSCELEDMEEIVQYRYEMSGGEVVDGLWGQVACRERWKIDTREVMCRQWMISGKW